MTIYDELDPGIRETVRLLHSWGRETTDSGDGKHKGLDGEPVPHVYIASTKDLVIEEADALRAQFNGCGITCGQVQATYSPDDGYAMVSIHGIDDAVLREAGVP